MKNTPLTDFYRQHVKNLKPVGNGQLKGLCPFHDDRHPSLSVNLETGSWFCHACVEGGGPRQLAERLGVEPPDDGKRDKPEATFDYHDEDGSLLFQVVRFQGKQFRQRRPDGSGGWVWGLKDVRRVVYRLQDLKGKRTVFVTEGEKDCDRLWALGIPATTCPMGAGKWREEFTEQLKAAGIERVVILPDNDEEGRKHGESVALSCLKSGLQVKVVSLPDLPPKGDVSDWLGMGHTKADLAELVKATPLLKVEDLKEKDTRKAKTGDSPKGKYAGQEITLPEPEPWDEAVDGVELLDELVGAFRRYLVLPAGAVETMALWVIHTHTVETAEITPRLALLSPVKRCGKTRTLSVLQKLVYRPVMASNITSAGVFRIVEAWRPTLLIDEADTFLRGNDELRGVLNSGHSRTGCVPRVEGEGKREPRLFFTFSPMAIAQIGELPGTIEDRAIIIPMHRKKRSESVKKLRIRRTADLDTLARKVARWAEDNIEALAEAVPETPDALHDRAADNWEHLLAIADLAGGPWPERARAVAVTLSGGAEIEDGSARVMLLTDLATLFNERNTDRLFSEEICDALAEMEDKPWPEWSKGKPITPRQVAKLLKRIGPQPKQIRKGDKSKKGYERVWFDDAFARYIPPVSETAKQDNVINGLDENLSETSGVIVSDEKDGKPSRFNDVSDVSDRAGGLGKERSLFEQETGIDRS